MRVSRITSRSVIPGLGMFGKIAGKIFYDDSYLDGSRKEVPAYDPTNNAARTQNQQNSFARNIVGASKMYGTVTPSAASQVDVNYATLGGTNSEDFISVSGVTAGQRFRCEGGRILRGDGSIFYAPSSLGYSTNLNHASSQTSPVACHLEIIHETSLYFVIYARGLETIGSPTVLLLSKATPTSPSQYIRGNFHVEKIGLLQDPSSGAVRTAFLMLSHSYLSEVANVGAVPGAQRPASANAAFKCGAYVLSFCESSNLGDQMWLTPVTTLGAGPVATQFTATQNQRTQISWDNSLVEYNAQGRVVAVNLIGSDLSLATEAAFTGSSPTLNGLSDNLTLFRFTIDPTTTLTTIASKQKLTLPAEYLSAQWALNGSQNVENYVLISGKAFSVVDGSNQKQLKLYMNRVGFESYQSRGAAATSYYANRTQPNIGPVLLSIPISDQFAPIGPQVITRFPVMFGQEQHHEATMLLSPDKKRLALPNSIKLLEPTQQKTACPNTIAVIDTVANTHEVISLSIPRQPTAPIAACGWIGNELFVSDGYEQAFILDEGPTVSLSIEAFADVGATAQLTVTVSQPATVTLYAFGGTFDGAPSKTVDVQDTLTLDVLVKNDLRVHVTSCVALVGG